MVIENVLCEHIVGGGTIDRDDVTFYFPMNLACTGSKTVYFLALSVKALQEF